MHATGDPRILCFTRQEREACALDDVEQLVQQHRVRLLRFVIFSIGDQDLAESIVQDSFIRAYNTRTSFRGDCSVHTWLRNIALNMIRDYQRTQKFRFWRSFRKTAMDITEVAFSLPGNTGTPETNLLMREKLAQVYSVLEELSFNQRTIFLMRFQEGMSVHEISLATRISLITVKTHLHRAVHAVRVRMRETES